MVPLKARVFVRTVQLALLVPTPLLFSQHLVLRDTFVQVVSRCPREHHVRVERIFLLNMANLKMSAWHARLASTVNFLARLTQLDLVVPATFVEVEPDFFHLMMRVIQAMALARQGSTVKREQQMAPGAPKEPSGHTPVLNRVMTVCLVLEGNIVINLDCSLQPKTVTQVTTAQQKKTFAFQNQATSFVQLGISVQRALPTHLAVHQGHIRVVNSKYHVTSAQKASTALPTLLTP